MPQIAYKHVPEHPMLTIQRGQSVGNQTVIAVNGSRYPFQVDAHISLAESGIIVVERRAAFMQTTLLLLGNWERSEGTPIVAADGVTLYSVDVQRKPFSISAGDSASLDVSVWPLGISVRERTTSGMVDRHTEDRSIWKVVAETRLERVSAQTVAPPGVKTQ